MRVPRENTERQEPIVENQINSGGLLRVVRETDRTEMSCGKKVS